MKRITQHYGADLEWVHSVAKQYGGKVKGNFIVVPEEISTGPRYYLKCGKGIVALYLDLEYKSDLCLIQKNLKHDFLGLYFNLSQSEAKFSCGDDSDTVGSWAYNLACIDSSSTFQFEVKAGSRVFLFCIFIKKEAIELLIKKNGLGLKSKGISKILNPSKQDYIEWDRMNNVSFHILDDLRNQEVGDILFDLNMIGTVNILLSEYLSKLSNNRIVIRSINEKDLRNIIQAQRYLVENLEKKFPGISFLALEASMSESKFKRLFYQMTDMSPNSFFIDNKLVRAKHLLEEKELTVTQISDQLNFGSLTFFSAQFKKKFGILPKLYSLQL
ncbi:AraC family transcriptional regulator [Flavobacterium sp. TR2]|uniref:helix-turn-helix domain-containing protein n=1 Tax=Flavobacterium sp. TR2 TaxID=2977321 RepID=UPI0021B0A2E1|nr:AraC family transcriptional regulator [Flavobacterium sp. TR2]UWY27729.1 AraC family transcriptional regulator [Flavobacterium sp. TR2]